MTFEDHTVCLFLHLQRKRPRRQTHRSLRLLPAAPALAAAFLVALPVAAPASARPPGSPAVDRASAASTRSRPGGPATARAAAVRRAPSPPPLSRVLARTFRFYGGVDAILAVGGLRVRGTIADATTAPRSRPQLERLLLPPDRYRSAVSLGGVERETLVLDGGRAFRDGAEVTGLTRADQIRLEAARTFLPAALARGRDALVDRGETRRAGRRLRLVELPLHEQATLTAEIDSASGRILRAVIRVAGRETAVSFRRFRPVDGVLFPFAEDLEAREGKRTVMVETVEVVPADSLRIDHP